MIPRETGRVEVLRRSDILQLRAYCEHITRMRAMTMDEEYDPNAPGSREAVIAAIEHRLVDGNLVTITREEFEMLRSTPCSPT